METGVCAFLSAWITPFDPILFYDPEAFEVDFGTTLPIARIELDQNIQFELKTADLTAEEIADGFTAPTTAVTTYHIFRDLKINAAQIEVDVQGVTGIYRAE